jgi:GT2 family glycosyltransferase
MSTEERPAEVNRAPLPRAASVSVVVATRDRPAELRECLRGLAAQASPRAFDVIVVDNNPDSGLTPPVVADFPRVRLVSERRAGVSYARNAGVAASGAEIVVTVDDDVTAPPGWLEKLLAPFARGDVMIVTGNVLPLEPESEASRLFEAYGGLGRGDAAFEVGREWFDSFKLRAVPTWRLGGTANAAFRAGLFGRAGVGLMNVSLGPGTPTGVGEDTYLFYRALKEGCTIRYEPAAFVRHRHRRDMASLRRQIYNYSKGHVAYHLTTLIDDRDLRALARLAVGLPATHAWRILRRLPRRGERQMLALSFVEVAGNLAGPWSLWRARRRVRREGGSSRAADRVAAQAGGAEGEV